MSRKSKLMILYDWFYPGFRAGGPIQSLTNLAVSFQHIYDISVVTTAFDANSTEVYNGIQPDNWNDVYLKSGAKTIRVFYCSNPLTSDIFLKLFEETKPDIIYLNSVFSYRFSLLPLLSVRSMPAKPKIVMCPRGMLKAGALSSKAFKKKIYLAFLRTFGLLKNAYWHATNQEEADDVRLHFPKNKGIVIAPNIPKVPLQHISFLPKDAGHLKLVSLSLINEHKNILLLLELLAAFNKNVELDIYGPVVDDLYWKKCEVLINQSPGKVRYKGDAKPAEVQQMLSQYHMLILLTKGENFGHSIYESFSVGRPVITSHFTPWNDLEVQKSGANVDISDPVDCMQKLERFYNMAQNDFNLYCLHSHKMATEYFENMDTEAAYARLFS